MSDKETQYEFIINLARDANIRLTRALALAREDLVQARADLKDLQGANRSLGQQLADVTENREFWFKAHGEMTTLAVNAENERNEWRKKAQEQSDEVQEHWLSPAEAEQQAEKPRRELEGVYDALDNCSIPRHYDNGAQASTRTRIFWLNQRAERAEAAEAELEIGHRTLTMANIELSDDEGRFPLGYRVIQLSNRAERAEALAALVTPELAALLERLACHVKAAFEHDFDRYCDDIQPGEPVMDHADAYSKDESEARALAARIREALEVNSED